MSFRELTFLEKVQNARKAYFEETKSTLEYGEWLGNPENIIYHFFRFLPEKKITGYNPGPESLCWHIEGQIANQAA